MRFQCWCALGLFVASTGAGIGVDSFPSQSKAGWHQAAIERQDGRRHYRYYIPDGLVPNSPLVILLHAGNQGMFKVFGPMGGGAKEWQKIAEDAPFLLLVPNGVNAETGDTAGDSQSWNDCRAEKPGARRLSKADDVGFIRDLISLAATDFKINRHRVYVTGVSNGGMMSYRLAMELGEELAGAAAFNANLPDDGECQRESVAVPMMIVNSTTDPFIPWSGGVIAGTPVLSGAETRDYWIRVNQAQLDKVEVSSPPDLDANDKSSVIKERYPASEGGAEVLFYRVEGAGHLMPSISHEVVRPDFGLQNRDIEGAREAWEFFRKQSRRPF